MISVLIVMQGAAKPKPSTPDHLDINISIHIV
jgi:hypothetical protein